jgi:hypothetical protein
VSTLHALSKRPQDLTDLDFWEIVNHGIAKPGEPSRIWTPSEQAVQETLQTEYFFDPQVEESIGIWDAKIGRNVPKGLMICSTDIRRRNERGEVTGAWRSGHIITTAGKTALAAWLAAASQSTAFEKWLGIGTGSTAAAVGDTALGGGVGPGPTEVYFATAGRGVGTASSATNVYQVTFTSTAGQINGGTTCTVAEAGMFSVVTAQTVSNTPSGTMYDRTVLSSTAVITSADTLAVTFQITFS